MELAKIEELFKQCSLQELYSLEISLSEFIAKAKQNVSTQEDDQGRQLRREPRIDTCLIGTLIRITDVKPGERKEFSITILDLSRTGMCFKVDTNFVPSRVIEVLFGTPGGKIKHAYMEIVRIKKQINQNGSWLEVGCRSIGDEAVRRIRLQEERIARMRSKFHKRTGLMVVIVGPEVDEITKIVEKIKLEGYQIRRVDNPSLAVESARKLKANIVIYCQGKQLCQEPKLLQTVLSSPSDLTSLALVENEEQQFQLYQAGIDECLLLQHVDELLFNSMERALLGHAIRQNDSMSGQILLVSSDNTKINLVVFQFEELGYICHIARSVPAIAELNISKFDMILADFDDYHAKTFQQIREKFPDAPLIALCEDMSFSIKAMAASANNYLCMPPTKENMRMILESSLTKVAAPV